MHGGMRIRLLLQKMMLDELTLTGFAKMDDYSQVISRITLTMTQT